MAKKLKVNDALLKTTYGDQEVPEKGPRGKSSLDALVTKL